MLVQKNPELFYMRVIQDVRALFCMDISSRHRLSLPVKHGKMIIIETFQSYTTYFVGPALLAMTIREMSRFAFSIISSLTIV